MNPYLSREIEPQLAEKGIRVISSSIKAYQETCPPFHRRFTPFADASYELLDVGGDKVGARLGKISRVLRQGLPYVFVLNANGIRPVPWMEQ